MGIKFANQLENPHVIKQTQIFVGVAPKGPRGVVLSSAYNHRDSTEYINDLGNAIINISKVVPEGVLVFFTSYKLLEKTIEIWRKVMLI